MNDRTSSALAARGSALPEDAADKRMREIAETREPRSALAVAFRTGILI